MYKIIVPDREFYDEEKNEFFTKKGGSFTIEHSLISISKWESKWEIPFLHQKEKTREQLIDYIKCMTLTQNVPDYIYSMLTQENFKEISNYINSNKTATTIKHSDHKRNTQIITSEIIYYCMVALNIPFECQKWHLNRLLMLIQVCNEKNKPSKNMDRRSLNKRNSAKNAARRARSGSRG